MNETASACVFCAIVAGDVESSRVFEDDDVLVFMDIMPVTPGHCLVIPKRHAAGLAELDPAVGGHMFTIAQRLAASLRRSGVRCDGVNFFLADGETAFQEVLHAHLHVLPRFEGVGFRIDAQWGHPDRDQLERTAVAVRNAL